MRRIMRQLARLFGVTFEDWMLTVVLVATIALAVGGVRSCAHDQFLDATPQEGHAR